MKKINILFCMFLFSFLLSAQVITYDTIRVSPDDERNIHRNSSKTNASVTSTTQQSQKVVNPPPASYQNVLGTGYDIDVKKLRYGADFGLYFSKNYSSFNFGPQMGYLIDDQFMVGVGVKYNYFKTRGYLYNEEVVYKNNLLGGNVFGYYYPTSYLVVFVQPEINHLWSTRKDEVSGAVKKSSGFVPSFLLGGGVRLGMAHLTLNYDLARHRNSPYSRGVFMGFSFFL